MTRIKPDQERTTIMYVHMYWENMIEIPSSYWPMVDEDGMPCD